MLSLGLEVGVQQEVGHKNYPPQFFPGLVSAFAEESHQVQEQVNEVEIQR